MKYVVYLHLYIPWKFGERGSTPRGVTRPSLSFFVCPSRYDAGTESLDGAYTHWTWGNGHKPPGQKSPRAKDLPDKRPPDKSTPVQKSPAKSPPAKSVPGQKTPGKKSPWAKDPRTKAPRTKILPAPDTQQAATYSIAAVAGNWTILVADLFATFVRLSAIISTRTATRSCRTRQRAFHLYLLLQCCCRCRCCCV